jgi:CHASE3 domain sensor protein
VLFLLGAGVLVYTYAQKQIDSANWTQHTMDVLSTLQRTSTFAERVQYRTRLFTLTRREISR